MDRLRIALLQGKAEPSVEAALAWTEARLAEAAAAGAGIACTQELFATPYFCRVQDAAFFDLAEPVPGPTTERLAGAARKLGLVLVVSLFERRGPGVYHNTAAVIDADGTYLGKYRKMHIPQDPGFEEKYYFTPGDLGFRAWDTRCGRIGVLICWDQWYPEAVRLTALQGAQVIFCPTAIGWLAADQAAVRARQRASWLTVQAGHAVANGCYLAAVNRVGSEGSIEFWGTSFVADFCGQRIAEADVSETGVLYAECDLRALEVQRRLWPFFRDRRIDAYGDIVKRFTDD